MISLKLWPGGFANFRVYIAKLNLDQLSRIHHPDGSDQPATIFDHLVLPSSHKEMLQALVHSHFRAKFVALPVAHCRWFLDQRS